MTTQQWPVSRTRRGFAPLPTPRANGSYAASANGSAPLPPRRKAVQPPAAPAAPTLAATVVQAPVKRPDVLEKAIDSLSAKSKATLLRALDNGDVPAQPVKRREGVVQAREAPPASTLAAPLPNGPQAPRQGREAARPVPDQPIVRPAGTAIRDAIDARVTLLRGQIRQDCEVLATQARAIGRRINSGDAPRQEGEFMMLARKLDQDCASLYECERLLKTH